ncbi:hypothetical protein [Streptomyces sp. NPDC017673]|uniref:hypothetical protein n=1 Tax=unclassified Streptomyces TaxID=2593676 RepID=UPI00378DD2B2
MESRKAVVEGSLPVAGEAAEANPALDQSLDSINDDSDGDGRLIRLRTDDVTANGLLGADEYAEYIAEDSTVLGDHWARGPRPGGWLLSVDGASAGGRPGAGRGSDALGEKRARSSLLDDLYWMRSGANGSPRTEARSGPHRPRFPLLGEGRPITWPWTQPHPASRARLHTNPARLWSGSREIDLTMRDNPGPHGSQLPRKTPRPRPFASTWGARRARRPRIGLDNKQTPGR